jgi:hypothetical protein
MLPLRRLPEIRVTLERVPPEQRAVPLDYPDNLGLRTKLGGEPEWIQGDDTPACPHCGRQMTFVAQIDSIEHDSPQNPLGRDPLGELDYMFGDVGMIYVFFCEECCEPGCVHQCY